LVDGLDGDVGDHFNVVAAQLFAQQSAQLEVDGWHDCRACSTRVTARPRAVKASAISRPM
jgi:hypothetical protein